MKAIVQESKTAYTGHTFQSFGRSGKSYGEARAACNEVLIFSCPINLRTRSPGLVVESDQGIELDQRMKISEHEISRKVNQILGVAPKMWKWLDQF